MNNEGLDNSDFSNTLPRRNSAVDVNQQPGMEAVAIVNNPNAQEEEYTNHVLNQIHQVSYLHAIIILTHLTMPNLLS